MNRRIQFLFCLLLSISLIVPVSLCMADTTFVGGNIESDSTWAISGSPYFVTSDVRIINNSTLIIEPGVEVNIVSRQNLLDRLVV